MSPGESPDEGLEDLLGRLELTIARLADGTAPLEELVAGHQRASSLLADAERRLDGLKVRADRLMVTLRE